MFLCVDGGGKEKRVACGRDASVWQLTLLGRHVPIRPYRVDLISEIPASANSNFKLNLSDDFDSHCDETSNEIGVIQ